VNELLVLFVAGMGMWAMRASAILLAQGRTLPESVTRALGYAKHAVLAALIGAAVTIHDGSAFPPIALPQLIAAVAAMLIAWRLGNTLMTVLGGVLVTTMAVAAGF